MLPNRVFTVRAISSSCYGIVRTRLGVYVCLTTSAQGGGKLIFGVGIVLDGGKSVYVKTVDLTLTLTYKMRPKCGGHEMSIGHI